MVLGIHASATADDRTALGVIMAVVFGSLLLFAWLQFARRSLTPGKLVLDRGRQELRFYQFCFSLGAHHRLALKDINDLSHRELMSSGNAEGSGQTYDILVAELLDGRTASIAIDSAYRLEVEIRKAIGLPETEAIKRKRGEEQRLAHRWREIHRRR